MSKKKDEDNEVKEALKEINDNRPPDQSLLSEMRALSSGSARTEEKKTESLEEAMGKSVTVLSESQRLKALSDISKQEANQFTALYALAKLTNNHMLEAILDTALELKISIDRKGRIEIKDVAIAAVTDAKSERRGGMFDFLKGK